MRLINQISFIILVIFICVRFTDIDSYLNINIADNKEQNQKNQYNIEDIKKIFTKIKQSFSLDITEFDTDVNYYKDKTETDNAFDKFVSSEKNINAENRIIKVNPLMDFNYKTKDEIYNIRKNFVKQSLFANSNYEPNPAVFSTIVDNKPWIGIKSMNFIWSIKKPNAGLSEESRFINNPSALVMIDMVYRNVSKGIFFDENMFIVPSNIVYSKSKNTIFVTYKIRTFYNELKPAYKKDKIFALKGINANDFNYRWGFAYKTTNVLFNKDSINDKAVQFKTFLHLGSSAGIEGGANNSSPRQDELFFSISQLPAYIKLKLWRNYPENIFGDADIYLDIILE